MCELRFAGAICGLSAKGAHKGWPYEMDDDMRSTRGEGAHKGWPYEMDDDVIYTGEGTDKGWPYEMDDDVIYTGGGRPQGVALRDG